MKKILLIFLIACNPIVRVGINENFTTVTSGFIRASIVTGFDHQYDSTFLTVTNNSNSLQYFYKQQGKPSFNNISLSEGNYGFLINTNEADTISYFMEFIAYDINIDITQGINDILLNAESKQALILVDKNTVEGLPTIQINNQLGLMSVSDNYYYAYVKQSCIVKYSIAGNEMQMPINIQRQKIYLFTAGLGNVNISDPFIEVIEI